MAKGRTRWFILAWLFVLTLVSYMDRANLSMAVPLIMKDFHLNASQIGMAISGLTIGYTLLNFPGGFLADRFSPKKILMLALTFWSLFTIATGMVGGLAALVFVRRGPNQCNISCSTYFAALRGQRGGGYANGNSGTS